MFFKKRERRSAVDGSAASLAEFDPDPAWTNEAYVIYHNDRIFINAWGDFQYSSIDGLECVPQAEFDLPDYPRPGVSVLYVFRVPDGYEVAMGNDGENHLYDPLGTACRVETRFFGHGGLTVSSPHGVFNTSSPLDRQFTVESLAPDGSSRGKVACEIANDPETGAAWVSVPGYRSPGYARRLSASFGGAVDTSRALPPRGRAR